VCNPLLRTLHSAVGIRSASKPPMHASDSLRTAVSLLLTRARRDGVRMKIFEWALSISGVNKSSFVCSPVSHIRAGDR
jgi:hypothetical protein